MKKNKVVHDFGSFFDDIEKFEQERKTAGKNNSQLYRSYSTNLLSSNVGDPYSPSNIQSLNSTEDNKSWYENVFDFIKTGASSAWDIVSEDIPNSLRMLDERINDGHVATTESRMADNNDNKRHSAMVQEYLNMVKYYRELLAQAQASGGNILYKGLLDQIKEEIDKYDQYFKTEGKNNPVVADLLYNDGESLTASEEAYSLSRFVNSDLYKPNRPNGIWNSTKGLIKEVMNIGIGLGKLMEYGYDQAVDRKGFAEDVVQRLDLNNSNDRIILDKLYNGQNINILDVQQRLQYWNIHTERLDNLYDRWYKYDLNRKKEGLSRIAIPFTDKELLIDTSDPEDVPEQWRAEQQVHAGEFWSHPLYTLPEVGSTIGLGAGMVGTIVADGLARLAIRELPSLVLAPEAKLLKLAKLYKSPQMIAKATAMMEKAKASSKFLPYGEAGIMSADIATAIWLTKESRRLETAQEAAEAQKQRLIQSLDNTDSDPRTVYNAIVQTARQKGIDISNMKPDQLIGLALAYDIDTGDLVFDQNKKEARKGLMKLINANNALAAVDYITVLPFVSYGTRVLSDFGRAIPNNIFGKTVVMPRFTGRKEKGLWKALVDNYKTDVALSEQLARLTPELQQTVINGAKMQAAYDGRVFNFAKNLIKKDHKVLGMMAQHAAKWFAPTMKKYAHVGFFEGMEEGLQEILQKRYQRGEYDDYEKSYSMFDIPEVFNNINLGKDVIKAWFGLGSEDIHDIRKASLIGASASMFFPFLGRTANSFTNTHDNHFLNLIKQLNTDWAMRKMISDNYKEIHDHNHLSMYYDMFRRAGVDNVRLRKSLDTLKASVDENSTFATPEYIDDDILLMENVYTAYKDDQFAKNLATNGIKKFSPEYKTAVINYGRALQDLWEDNRGILKADEKKNEFELSTYNTLKEYINPNTSEERKKEIKDQSPEIDAMSVQFKKLFAAYKTMFDEHIAKDRENAPKIKKAYKRHLMSLSDEELLKNKSFVEAFSGNLILRGILQSSGLSENNAIMKARMLELRNDEKLFESIVDLATRYEFEDLMKALDDARALTEDEYFERLSKLFNLYQQLKRAEGMLLMFKDLERTLKKTRLITGRDIKTDKLRGMIDGLNDLIKALKEEEKEMFGKNGELVKMFEDLNISLPNQEQYNNIIDELLIFTSISNPHRKIASAYMYDKTHGHELITPQQFIDAIFGDTVRVADPLYNRLLKLTNEYKQLTALQETEEERGELGKKQGSAESADLFSVEKRAAMAIVMEEMNEAAKRIRIAHKLFEEDAREQLGEPQVQQEESEQENQPQTEGEQNPDQTERKTTGELNLDTSLGEDPILEILDNDGEETKKRKEALKRMEEREKKKKDERSSLEEKTKEPKNDKKDKSDSSDNPELKPELPLELKTEPKEIFLLSIPIEEGLIQRVNIDGQIFEIVAHKQSEKEDDETKNNVSVYTISTIPNCFYSVYTELFGNAYEYSENSNIAKDVRKVVVIRPHASDESLNAPIEIRLINSDDNIIGFFVRTEDSSLDDDEADIVTGGEGVPDVDSLDDVQLPDVSGENQVQIPDVTGEGLETTPIITGEGLEETPIFTGEGQEEAPIVEGNLSELTINTIGYDETHGLVDQFGVPLTDKEQESLANQDSILSDIDFYRRMSALFEAPREDNNGDIQDEGDLANYFAQTLFYDPEANDPIDLSIGSKNIKLKYPLRSGKELARKLLDHGWIQSCYKYFVVTQAQDAAYKSSNDPDSFTVTLIVEDETEKASYAISYRQLGKYMSKGVEIIDGREVEREYFVDHEQERRDFLLSIHGEGKTTSDRIRNYKDALYSVIMERKFLRDKMTAVIEGRLDRIDEFTISEARRNAENWLKNIPKKRNNESEDAFENRKKMYESERELFIELARDRISRKNRKKIPIGEIEKQIQKLRENRMVVINQYLEHHEENGAVVYEFPSPEDTKRTVIPESIVLSNGKFDNQKDGEVPVVNNLSKEGNVFGIGGTTEEISRQIRDNEVVLGVGSGDFRTNEAYTINDFRRNVQWKYDITRGGIAGKIYLIVNTPNGNQVPLMLLEQKFDKQYENDGNYHSAMQSSKLKLCLNTDGSIVDESVIPSAAEVLLYLLVGNINTPQFSALTTDLLTQFANLFVNNGEKTILKDSRVEDKVPQYAAKQLQVIRRADGKNAIIIGLPIKDGDGVETGKYRQTYISYEELFNPADDSRRKEVVLAIARQMHWNTDRDVMANTFGGSSTNLILLYLEEYFKNNPEEESYSLYGVPEFTFNKRDLFNVDDTGAPINSKNDVTVMSWLLKTGKLYTDVSDDLFKAPWVFVGSSKSNSSDTILTGENNAIKTGTGDVDINETINQGNKGKGSEENKGGESKQSFNLFDEENYKNLPGLIRQKKVVKETPLELLPKKILIADPKDPGKKYEDKKEFAKYLKDRINNLVKELNNSGKFSVTIVPPENIEEYVTSGMAFDQIRQRYVNPSSLYKVYPIVNISADGKMYLQHSNYLRKLGATEVNGVYQTKKSGGFMNRTEALSWLKSKLGIDEHDVLVSEIAMRSVENGEDVFGVMNVAFDNLRELFAGSFILNPTGGRGLHYHEAWHYVNLLLHDTATQRRIYDAYANSHPEYKGVELIEIEEALAEEFRMWMELRDAEGFKNTIKGIIKRFFYAVADMLHLSGDKAKYRAVFRAINSGSYEKVKISQQSVKEFQKFYKNGVYSIYAPGHDKKAIDNISKIVTNSNDFNDVLAAITDYVFLSVDIRTEADLRQLCADNFPSILEDLSILNLTDDIAEDVKPIINVFLQNPEAIRYGLVQKMKEFGIITKRDSISTARQSEELENEEQPTEDEPWNIFDRFQFTVSKKVNSAFLAKLFLHMIPDRHFVIDENGKPVLEDTPNPIIPTIPKFVPYDEVWNRLRDEFKNLNNSWGIKGKDGQYERYSLRGIVKKQVELNDPLFATIDELLDDCEDDTQLKSALVTSLNSQKPNISQFQLLNQFRTLSKLEKAIAAGEVDMSLITQEILDQDRRELDAFCIADRNKQWKLLNDNTLRASRSIPRTWSNMALSHGLIDYKNDGKISQSYYKFIRAKYDKIIEILNNNFDANSKKRSEHAEEKLPELKDKVVDLLSNMGVNIDIQTLNFYLYSKISKGNISPIAEGKEIKKMFAFYTPGTFGYIINLIKNNIDSLEFIYIGRKNGKIEVKDKMKKPIEIEKLYSKVSSKSVITKMALAKFAVHPGSAEYGVVDANGNMLYPTSLNNFISSKQRLLNTTGGQEARSMLKSPYAKNSLILNLAKTFSEELADEDQIKFNVHVGLRGKVENTGEDYFGITSIEDYIIKMILLDQDPLYGLTEDEIKKGEKNNEYTHLILPTMADKKTYGDFSHRDLRTAHDPFIGSLTVDLEYAILEEAYNANIYDPIDDQEDILSMRKVWIDNLSKEQRKEYIDNYKRNNPGFNRFSEATLKIFANYFLDEIEALIQYYSKKNIQYLLDNPTKRKKNFHGKIWTHNNINRIDFSGNGGLFRYFYDSVHTGIFDTLGNEINLNQKLEMLYNVERQFIEQGEDSKIPLSGAEDIDDEQFMSLSSIDSDAESLDDLDGFELIRKELENIKKTYFETIYDANKPVGIKPTETLLKGINDHIVLLVEDELVALYSNPNLMMAKKVGDIITPTAVPAELLQRQFKRFKKDGILSGEYTPYSKSASSKGIDALLLKSLIANHVANTAISIIEFEKVFQGDPSYFKYQYLEDEDRNREKRKVYTNYTLPNGQQIQIKQEVSVVTEKETDKIKRLGSLLSPGDEQMLSYTEEDYKRFKNLPKGDKFTNMVISDINASSRYVNDILIPQMKRQLLVNYIRKHNFEPIQQYVKKVQDEKGENEFDLERAINQIYFDFKIDTENGKVTLFDYLFDKLDDVNKKIIERQVKQKVKPYTEINVSDAQVLIRPLMYRKIRIGLGKWKDEDEEAFWILETDASWMSDPEKAAKVQKLELFPLKMAYYSNDPEEYSKGDMFNTPTLGKQAIFPWFKYQASSEVGQQLYKRMNQKGSEIDFLSFDSAVKVGAPQEQLSVYPKGIQHLGEINEDLNKESNYYIDKNGNLHYREGNTLPVLVQDLKYLRYQLNTQAHKTHERAIGTQMFKIAFSNIDVEAMYGLKKKGVQPILGRNLRRDIMRNVSLLTKIGALTIESEFYRNGNVSDSEMRKWTRRIIENNDLGATADEIIRNGAVAESLMNRKTFELAVSKLVNKEVVDITTNGGTAVQQSAFGFDSFDNSQIDEWDGKTYHKYNDGKGLKWIVDGNSGVMLVFLGMNFFKSVVPEEFRTDYKKMRDWLLEHNIIGDNAKPYGLGYRIPTQGLSSIFTFQVADVLPEQQGDVIVVPYEFTAQTGSDFDVDKLFLSTFSFTDGVLDTIEDDLYKYYTEGVGDVTELCKKYNLYEPLPRWKTKNKTDHYTDEEYYEDRSDFDKNKTRQKKALNKLLMQYKGAIQNRLLEDYIMVLSDTRMFTINRGSIDVISDAIHDDVLSWLKPTKTNYLTGMYELTPSYQAMKKLEFSVGKNGISIFALNITNLALTQFSNLALDYEGNNPYELGSLKEILGEDDNYTADWLSAMINACVDVAKDPYIFVLNTNEATFDTAAFLLRSGKGISTFTFLAQPILKQYAAESSVSGGIYGNNITGYNITEESKNKKDNGIKVELLKKHLKSLEDMQKQFTKEQWDALDQDIKTSYAELKLYIKYKYGSKDEHNKALKLFEGSSKKNKNKKPQMTASKAVFNFDLGKAAILNYDSEDISKKFESYVFLIKAMKALMDIEPYIRKMSDLVQLSQIDTKKFGNDIVKLLNYEARIKTFRYNSEGWIIDTKKERDISRQIPGYALGKYYSTMFLEEKFSLARKYTKELLATNLLVGTDAFENLFVSIAKELNGTETYNVPKTEYNPKTKKLEYVYETTKSGKKKVVFEQKETFKPFYNEDSLESISQAINNIARFNIVMNYGTRTQNKKLLPGGENFYSDPIDFSQNGDFSKLIRKIHMLLFGDSETKSVPGRVQDFISYILKNPDSKEAFGLVEDGKLINVFLDYLQPMIKTSEIPIDRLLLNDSQYRTNKNKKSLLSSGWYELFTHESETVRNLAKDIALYSYYTTYDTPSINSLTDILPSMFRTMYDNALKDAIKSDESKLIEYMSIDYFTKALLEKDRNIFTANVSNQGMYLDIICKNYWYKNDVVRLYNELGSGSFELGSNHQIEWRGVKIRTKENNVFSGIIATVGRPRGLFTHPGYMKIRKGNETMLYKKIGVVEKSEPSVKDKKMVTSLTFHVYVAIQKAGLFVPSKNLHMFEFYANEFIPSIFRSQNILPEKFDRLNLLNSLAKLIEKWNKDPQSKSKGYVFKFKNSEEFASEMLNDNYNQYVYRKKTGVSFEDPIVNDKDLFFSTERKLSINGHKSYSDLIISINKEQPDYEEKTLHVGKDEEFMKVIDAYIEKNNVSGPLLITIDSDIQELNEDGTPTLNINKKSIFYPTKEEVDSYVDGLIDVAIEDMVKKNPYMTQSEIQEIREELKKLAGQFNVERNVAIQKLATAIANIINYISIKHKDVSVRQLRINGLSLDAVALIAVQKALRDNIEYKMAFKVDRISIGTPAYKDFLNLYKANITVNEEDIYDEDAMETPQEGVQKLLEQYIPEAVEEEDDALIDDEDFNFDIASVVDQDAILNDDIIDLEGEKQEAEQNNKITQDEANAPINNQSNNTTNHEGC